MADRIRLGEDWYILAASSPPDERRRVLKQGQAFALFDRFGDIQPIGLHEDGLYHGDTRFLSHQELRINGVRPMFLNSTVRDDNGLLIVELMNPDLNVGGKDQIHKGLLHIFRAKLLWRDALHEHVRVVNFGLEPINAVLSLEMDADYVDIFEIRGFRRQRRGVLLAPELDTTELVLGYQGLDQVVRKTRITYEPAPDVLSAQRAEFRLRLAPREEAHVYLTIACEPEEQAPRAETDYFSAYTQANAALTESMHDHCRIVTSNPMFDRWLDRSTADLAMLATELPGGQYPFAGLPWYSTTFGRDGIITARQMLWLDPGIARGVLSVLADTQAASQDPARDAEPGKILHEARLGELAALDEIPFRRYYGTVDATPLFIGLAGAYFERTGDLDFIRRIWGNIERALNWIDEYGDRDGDGFVEYARRTDAGLTHQGWKDSHDAVFHEDGRLAEAPIALCEVQGYVYEAKRQAGRLAERLGKHALAKTLKADAVQLKERFNQAFWCERIGSYALALDGDKRQCAVPSSNAGHTLWSGIADPAYAARIAEQLVSDDFFSGWGIRTIPGAASRYNPMAYHNGSVWPHDNAIIAEGMARYGDTGRAMKVFGALYDASLAMDQHRMPELFCGFPRRPDEGPTLYPVACSPQAWAAGSVFSLLQACLGLSFAPDKPEIRFRNPRLPPFLDTVEIRDLSIRGSTVDLLLQRYPNNVGVNIVRKDGPVEVVVVA
ncbi:MAG: amylo-alpha-1,6-glucosidase [Noviherbaspirillum sp.]